LIARIASGIAALALLVAASSPAGAAASKPATHMVAIEGTRFQPEALAAAAGDTVVWINKDPFPHTVTSKAGAFDSREIQPGESWKFAPRTKGEFAYICSLHPTMKGTLRVR
jgi:plastocyanin